MSTSSDNQTPEFQGELENPQVASSWEFFSSRVSSEARQDLGDWLEGELSKLEEELEAFVSTRERLGRR